MIKSFYQCNPDSIALIKKLDSSAKTAILASSVSSCLDFAFCHDVDALYPYVEGFDIGDLKSRTMLPVRVFGSEPIFPSKETFEKKFNLDNLVNMGVTDIFTNNPKLYLQ